jgi:hypothetical protein
VAKPARQADVHRLELAARIPVRVQIIGFVTGMDEGVTWQQRRVVPLARFAARDDFEAGQAIITRLPSLPSGRQVQGETKLVRGVVKVAEVIKARDFEPHAAGIGWAIGLWSSKAKNTRSAAASCAAKLRIVASRTAIRFMLLQERKNGGMKGPVGRQAESR